MRDILRLLLGDGDGDGTEGWDQPGRRARVADSREWCGSGPDDEAIRQVARQLRGRGPGPRRVVVRRAGPFGL